MSDNILTLKFPHRSFSPPPKKASLVAPRSTPCIIIKYADKARTFNNFISFISLLKDANADRDLPIHLTKYEL